MIGYSFKEIVFSVICALAYGALFAMLSSFLSAMIQLARGIPKCIKTTVTMVERPRFRDLKGGIPKGSAPYFLTPLLMFIFALGFLLLSYFALDGSLRLYMLFLSFASLYLSKFAFSDFLSRGSGLIILFFVYAFSLALRPFFKMGRYIFTHMQKAFAGKKQKKQNKS